MEKIMCGTIPQQNLDENQSNFSFSFISMEIMGSAAIKIKTPTAIRTSVKSSKPEMDKAAREIPSLLRLHGALGAVTVNVIDVFGRVFLQDYSCYDKY